MGNVIANLIEPLEQRFEWRDASEEVAAKEDMIEAFSGFSDELLLKAAKQIRQTRIYRTMPMVGEIRKVLVDLVPPAAAYTSSSDYVPEEWRGDAISRANELIRSDMGRRAAQEGWLLGLHDHCRRHGALPDAAAIEIMKENARWFEQYAEKGNARLLSGRALKLRNLRAIVEGEDA